MKFPATFAATAAALLVATGASAQTFQKPEDAIKYRRSAMTVMAVHFGVLGAMSNNRIPFDAQAAARSADVIALVSHLPFASFVPRCLTWKTCSTSAAHSTDSQSYS